MKFVEGNWLFKENVHKNEVFQNKCINQQKYAFSFSYRHSRMPSEIVNKTPGRYIKRHARFVFVQQLNRKTSRNLTRTPKIEISDASETPREHKSRPLPNKTTRNPGGGGQLRRLFLHLLTDDDC